MGSVYALVFSYVDAPLLRPVMDELAGRKHDCHWGNMHSRGESRRWRTWLDSEGPRVVLTTGDLDQPGHTLTAKRLIVAREAGANSVSVLHGSVEWPMPPALAGVACLWGEYYRQFAQPTGKVAITGNPALDAAPDPKRARMAVAEAMGWSEPRDYILWAAIAREAREPRVKQASLELFHAAIAEAAKRLPVIMRPHPRDDNLTFYRELAASPEITIWPGDSAECGLPALHRGAALVMGNSSVLTEAAICGTPALFVRNEPGNLADDVVCFNWAGPDSIDTALRGGPSAAFTERFNGGPPGRAAEYVADVVEKVLRGQYVEPFTPYDTHLPALRAVCEAVAPDRVLEFGGGKHSTPLLSECAGRVETVEADASWRAWLAAEGWPNVAIRETFDGDFGDYDLIFIDDGHSIQERVNTIQRVTAAKPEAVIVIHDFQSIKYREAASGFDHQIVYDRNAPHTGVLWNGARPELEGLDL